MLGVILEVFKLHKKGIGDTNLGHTVKIINESYLLKLLAQMVNHETFVLLKATTWRRIPSC